MAYSTLSLCSLRSSLPPGSAPHCFPGDPLICSEGPSVISTDGPDPPSFSSKQARTRRKVENHVKAITHRGQDSPVDNGAGRYGVQRGPLRTAAATPVDVSVLSPDCRRHHGLDNDCSLGQSSALV